MPNFIEELQRRNVIKAMISYVVVSWVILQVASTLFPAFGISNNGIRLIIYVLIGGFPLWSIFAYIYEWTPGGFKKTETVSEEASVHRQTSKRLNALIIGGLSVAVILLVADRFFNISGTPPEVAEESKTIAVLPFENMSGNEDAYFAKGVTEDILTHISKIGKLRVLSNFTLRDYDSKGKTIKEIGKELSVSHLLTGSIRRAGEQLRITCQLVQVNPEEQTWAENFDRRVDDIFAIQTQVATEVAQQLEVQLTAQEAELINTRPTENLEAYNLYLQGNANFIIENEENIQKAIDLYKQALALDEDFIEPYIGLILAYGKEVVNYGNKPMTFMDSLFLMSKHATEIAPNNHMAWEALAYQYLVKGDYEQGIKLSQKALSLNPNSARSMNVLGLLLREKSQLDQAIPLFEKANRLEPIRSGVYHYNLCMSYQYLEMFEESEKYGISALNVGIAQEISYGLLGSLYGMMGRKDKVMDCINGLLGISENTFIHNQIVRLAFYGALDDVIVKEYVNKVVSSDDYANIDHPSTTIAHCYLLKKNNQLDSMNKVLDKYEAENREFYKDNTSGTIPWIMTEVEMLRGHSEKALEYFEEMVDLRYINGYVFLKHNRLMQPLQNNPQYLKLADKMEQEIQRQRMNLRNRNNGSKNI